MNRDAQAFDILNRAYQHWQPNWIFLLYSGGYDSICSSHIAWEWAKSVPHERVKAVSIDTGVAADGWRAYVSRVVNGEGWTHEFWDNPKPGFYFENSRAYGTPYTKQMHGTVIYRNLKERALDAGRARHKEHARDRCMLVSGMWRGESNDRADTPEWLEDGAGLWVSPIVNWTARDIYEHRLIHDFELNPFYETLGGSGDCYCNWTRTVTVEDLKRHSPILAAKIEPMHEDCLRLHGYGYGETPSDGLLAERAGQLVLPGVEPIVSMCAGCRGRDALEATLERLKLERGEAPAP